MTRKEFFHHIIKLTLLGIVLMIVYISDRSIVKRLYYKITGKGGPSVQMPPDSERKLYETPKEGYRISVETALNSRCNSDYDNDPKKSHWGMFEKSLKLSDDQVKTFLNHIRIPRFTNNRLEVRTDGNVLTFVVDKQLSGIQKEWAMVESGMQQQAAGLISAAFGIGMVFRGARPNAHSISNVDYATTKMKIDAMRPAYNGQFWSSSSPDGNQHLMKGNLPEPRRDGNNSLIEALTELKTQSRDADAKPANHAMLSQLLWAARGRTPHWCLSNRWGLTIPTWQAEQSITSVCILTNSEMHSYQNWYQNRPAHSIKFERMVDRSIQKELQSHLGRSFNCFIMLTKNESLDRAAWEVGYQLLNLLLQAHVLNLSYKAILLDENQKKLFKKQHLKAPEAILGI